MDVFKNKFGYRQIPTTVLADFAKSELKRAYTLPPARRFVASNADDWGAVNLMALYHFSAKVLSRSGRNTVRAMVYRSGCKLYDEKTGEMFNYGHKSVEHVELLLPKDVPEWAIEIQKLMTEERRKGVQTFVDKVEG